MANNYRKKNRLQTEIYRAISSQLGGGGRPGREASEGIGGNRYRPRPTRPYYPNRGNGMGPAPGAPAAFGGGRSGGGVGNRRLADPFKLPDNVGALTGPGYRNPQRKETAGRRNETIGVLRNLGLIPGKDSEGIWNREAMQQRNFKVGQAKTKFQDIRKQIDQLKNNEGIDLENEDALIKNLQERAKKARESLKTVRTDRKTVVGLREKALDKNIAKLWNNPQLREKAEKRAVLARLGRDGNVIQNSPLVNSAGTNRYRRRKPRGGARQGASISA